MNSCCFRARGVDTLLTTLDTVHLGMPPTVSPTISRTTTCEKAKGNKNLFLGFQTTMTVSSSWSFEIGSKRIGDEFNGTTRKSVT